MVNKIVRGVSQKRVRFQAVVVDCWNQCRLSAETEFLETLGLKSVWFILEERLLGNNFQICPDICDLWVLDCLVTTEAACMVFQRAYSAKPTLSLVSIFQQGHPSSGVSTSARRCHEHQEQFWWETGFWVVRFSAAFGKVCVCVSPPLHPQKNRPMCFSCTHH